MIVHCLQVFQAQCQENALKIDQLKVGDQLTDQMWNFPLNLTDQSLEQRQVKLSEYKGKLIILDFWATWCSSCIAGFPKLEKLQTQFSDQIKVLLVTTESPSIVNPFLSKRNDRNQKLTLPTVLSDSLLHVIFPHRLIPHYVWIDANGTIMNITASNEVTAESISATLRGSFPNKQQKIDLDINRALFTVEALPEQKLQYYSILLKGYYAGLGSGTSYRSQRDTVHGIALTNSELTYIYQTASSSLLPHNSEKRMVIDALAKKALKGNVDDKEWNVNNLYSYEIRIPVSQSNSLYQRMLEHLNQATDFHGTITKKRITCLVLRKTRSLIHQSKGGTRENDLNENSELHIVNSPILALTGRLNNAFKDLIIDETGIDYHIDLHLKIHENDLEKTNEELKLLGLKLIETTRKTQVLFLQAD